MEKYCKSCGAVFNDLKFKICPHCGEELDTRYGRQPIPRKLRHEVFMRDGYRCRECGASKDETSLEIDHIVPVARGGTNDIDNLQTLCRECNRMKHTDTWVGGETDLDSLKRQLSQLNKLLNDKEDALTQSVTEEEEIIIKYDIIKLNEKIQDVEEKIQQEETKIKDNIIKKKEAETNDLTYKWLYTSVSDEKLSLLCDLLMNRHPEKMNLIRKQSTSSGLRISCGDREWHESGYRDYDRNYDGKFDNFAYYVTNPFKEYYGCINYIVDLYFERINISIERKNFLPINSEEFFRDIEQGNFDKYLKDEFTVLFYSILTHALDFKYSLILDKVDYVTLRSKKIDFLDINELKEEYKRLLVKYFSLDELKQLLKEIDEFMDKFDKLGDLKDIFLYNLKDNISNAKLRILFNELNIHIYHLPFCKVKYIIDNYSKDEIKSMINHIDYIFEISDNPIKIGIENEIILRFLFQEFNIEESFPQYLKFKILIDSHSEEEIKTTIKYIKDILEIIKSEINNEPNLEKSLDNNDYIDKRFTSIKNELIELNNLKENLLNNNVDYDFLSIFMDYDGEDMINYLLLNYSIDEITKMINPNQI